MQVFFINQSDASIFLINQSDASIFTINQSEESITVGAGSAQTVSRVDGGSCQCFRQTHPQVDTGQVHHHTHAQTVGVGVEVSAQSHNHTMLDHVSDWRTLQSQDVSCSKENN